MAITIIVPEREGGSVADINAAVETCEEAAALVTPILDYTADITALAALTAELAALGAITADIVTVAGISADVTAVAADATNIGIVATNIANVNAVGGVSGHVTTVAGIAANVTTVAGVAANVTTVAGISVHVTNVGAVYSDIPVVAGIAAEIETLAGAAANIATLAPVAADIAALGPIAADITLCADNIADIQDAAGIAGPLDDRITALEEGGGGFDPDSFAALPAINIPAPGDEVLIYRDAAFYRLTYTELAINMLDLVTAASGDVEYHIFLISGQSNAIGRATYDGGPIYPTGTLQYLWQDAVPSFGAATEPLDHTGANAGQMGPWSDFARHYKIRHPNAVIVFIPHAEGGTPMSLWQVGGAGYDGNVDLTNAAYTAAVSAFSGSTVQFKGFLWHHGESSPGDLDYNDDMVDMITGLRDEITVAGPTTPFVVGTIRSTVSADYVRINNIIASMDDQLGYTAVVDGVTDLDMMDIYHYDAPSYRTLGQRYEAAFAQAILAVPAAPDGVTDLAAAAGTETATLTWTQPAGNNSTILTYLIEANDGGGWDTVEAAWDAGDPWVADKEYEATGLTAGNYSFRVTPTNGVGAGPVSNIAETSPVEPLTTAEVYAAVDAAGGSVWNPADTAYARISRAGTGSAPASAGDLVGWLADATGNRAALIANSDANRPTWEDAKHLAFTSNRNMISTFASSLSGSGWWMFLGLVSAPPTSNKQLISNGLAGTKKVFVTDDNFAATTATLVSVGASATAHVDNGAAVTTVYEIYAAALAGRVCLEARNMELDWASLSYFWTHTYTVGPLILIQNPTEELQAQLRSWVQEQVAA